MKFVFFAENHKQIPLLGGDLKGGPRQNTGQVIAHSVTDLSM